MTIFRDAMLTVLERLQEHERRIGGHELRGKVKEVDTKKQLARLVIGKDDDGNEVLSPWLPYKQTAGAVKFHNPPSVGQVMSVRSESGDIEQGLIEPFRWNDENASPSEAEDEHVLTFGDVTVTLTGGNVTFAIGGVTVVVSGGGVTVNGGQIVHDGRNIGSTHKHTGVEPGAALSGEPAG